MRIGVNGVGRIGRHIVKNLLLTEQVKLVLINDINPDINNIAYNFNYDTLYGNKGELVKVSENNLYFSNYGNPVAVTHKADTLEVDWKKHNVDIIIDASGVHSNVLNSKKLIDDSIVKKCLITHSPKEVDFTMVLGANEEKYDSEKHHLISTSICDATALSPVLKLVKKNFGLRSGTVTTLHPWLNYQNVLDGPASSWSHPGEIYHHYALGRSVDGNLIPKPTTAFSATCNVLRDLNEENFISFSYRTPTAIVGSADLSLNLAKDTSTKEVLNLFESESKNYKWNIIKNNLEPLVSLDFKGSDYSAVVDHRWTQVVDGNLLKLVLWYDNEFGYSKRVCDQLEYVISKMVC